MERSALEAAGVPSRSILTLSEDSNLRIGNLLVSPRAVQGVARIVPAGVDALRSIVAEAPNLKRRLYVSRRGARRRGIANEAEVLDLAKKHGFSEVRPGELSVGAQARPFAEAEIIFGMHGAGLANSVFAPAGATVIELQPAGLDGAQIALYWNLAAVAGHRCIQVICPEADGQKGMNMKHRDIVVDVAHLDRGLTEWLTRRRVTREPNVSRGL